MPDDKAYTGEGMFNTLFPYFGLLSDELLESARFVYDHKSYDVDPAPNKTGGGIAAYFPYYRLTFYFNNAYGNYLDLIVTIHEMGHNNVFYWLQNNWNCPALVYDTAEVHSQGLELLMTRFYPELFGDQADEVTSFEMANMLHSLVNGCLYDEFQRWAYEEPDLTLTKLNRKYRELAGDYGLCDKDDEREEIYDWYDVVHTFTDPMYYISYATSAAGAFAFWEKSQEDYYAAVDDYLRFSALGFENGFEETFYAVGMESPMTESYLKRLSETIREKLLQVEPFTDVYADDWFGESVFYLSCWGIMRGLDDTAFGPDDTAARAQAMTVLARLMDWEPYTLDEGVAWAVENGISDGTDIYAPVTREMLIAMLFRCAKLNGLKETEYDDLSAFSDADLVSDWASEAMSWAVGSGIIEGIEDGQGNILLAPQEPAARAQLAAMVFRFCCQ